MADLREHRSEWELLGELDPLWAVLSDPSRKFGRWDPDEFFRTGGEEIEKVMRVTYELGRPEHFGRALDFGCGVGRLSRALAGYFEQVKGVDVSGSMVTAAREMNRNCDGCEFLVNDRDDLALFPDDHFDFIYSNIVLQHLPSRDMIFEYVGEFLRTMRAGGLLVFQLPNDLPFLVRIQPRRTVFRILSALRIPEPVLYWKLGLHPIRMQYVPRPDTVRFLRSRGGKVLRVVTTTDPHFSVVSSVYYVTKDS